MKVSVDLPVSAATATVVAVAVAAMSDQLRKGHDKDANGALSADLIAIIVITAIATATVFGGLRAWARRRGDGTTGAAIAALVLGVVTLPIVWWAGAPIVGGVGAWSFATQEMPQRPSTRLVARLGALLVVAAVVTRIAVVIAMRA